MGDPGQELPPFLLNPKFLLGIVIGSLARISLAVILGKAMHFLSPALIKEMPQLFRAEVSPKHLSLKQIPGIALPAQTVKIG